jgi:hypothetical protein
MAMVQEASQHVGSQEGDAQGEDDATGGLSGVIGLTKRLFGGNAQTTDSSSEPTVDGGVNPMFAHLPADRAAAATERAVEGGENPLFAWAGQNDADVGLAANGELATVVESAEEDDLAAVQTNPLFSRSAKAKPEEEEEEEEEERSGDAAHGGGGGGEEEEGGALAASNAAEEATIALPDGWVAYTNPEDGSEYFHNAASGETTYERPN